MSWAVVDRRLSEIEATIRAQLAPPIEPMTAPEMATRLGISLDPWQRRVLDLSWRECLLNCARQSGKSTVAALLGLEEVLFRPRGKVVVVSPSERQSGLLFATAMEMYRDLGGEDGIVSADIENRLSLELANGNKFYALPGAQKTVRGFSGITLLIIDEASQVDDALYSAVRPMLAVSGGRLLAPSTPFGKRGWWWDAFANGGPEWHRETIPAGMCPRISAEFLANERERLPALFYAAEYECQFTDTIDQYFPTELITAAANPAIRPLAIRPRREAS